MIAEIYDALKATRTPDYSRSRSADFKGVLLRGRDGTKTD
jgi:hypothetical protein